MKPLITFRFGCWYCSTYTPGAWVGMGRTPGEAYASWKGWNAYGNRAHKTVCFTAPSPECSGG